MELVARPWFQASGAILVQYIYIYIYIALNVYHLRRKYATQRSKEQCTISIAYFNNFNPSHIARPKNMERFFFKAIFNRAKRLVVFTARPHRRLALGIGNEVTHVMVHQAMVCFICAHLADENLMS